MNYRIQVLLCVILYSIFYCESVQAQDIGEGWTLSAMDTKKEYDFVREEHSGLDDKDLFLIDGSTQSLGVKSYSEYNPTYTSGEVNVIITREGELLGGGRNAGTCAALCEKKLDRDFASATSFYKKIIREIGTHGYTLSDVAWTSACKDIGEGWALSVMNTKKELKFVRKKNSKLNEADQDTLLIGGSTQQYGEISYSQYDTTYTSGAVHVQFTHGGKLFGAGTDVAIASALCEKAKQ